MDQIKQLLFNLIFFIDEASIKCSELPDLKEALDEKVDNSLEFLLANGLYEEYSKYFNEHYQ